MGDNYLKQQAKNFRKRTDLAFDNLDTPTLFTRPDVVNRVFRAKPCGDEQFEVGETLWAIPDPNSHTVPVARGCYRLGVIDGDGASSLLALLPPNGAIDVLPMRVTRVLELSGVAELDVSEVMANE